jgi:hypothetical protein
LAFTSAAVRRQVRIERLVFSFSYPIKCESRRKKRQRFLALPKLRLLLLWFPLIKQIIKSQFKNSDRLIITIDRTQLIGDREYRGTALVLWLSKKKINFVLRLNKNTKIKPKHKTSQSLNFLEIKPGSKVLYNDV